MQLIESWTTDNMGLIVGVIAIAIWLLCGSALFVWELWRMVTTQRRPIAAGSAMALGWFSCNLGLIACLTCWPIVLAGELLTWLARPKAAEAKPEDDEPYPEDEEPYPEDEDDEAKLPVRAAGTWA